LPAATGTLGWVHGAERAGQETLVELRLQRCRCRIKRPLRQWAPVERDLDAPPGSGADVAERRTAAAVGNDDDVVAGVDRKQRQRRRRAGAERGLQASS